MTTSRSREICFPLWLIWVRLTKQGHKIGVEPQEETPLDGPGLCMSGGKSGSGEELGGLIPFKKQNAHSAMIRSSVAMVPQHSAEPWWHQDKGLLLGQCVQKSWFFPSFTVVKGSLLL